MKFEERINEMLNEGISKQDIKLNKLIQKLIKDPVWDSAPHSSKDGDLFEYSGQIDSEPFSIKYASPKTRDGFFIMTIGPENDERTPDSVVNYINKGISPELQEKNYKESIEILKDFGFKI